MATSRMRGLLVGLLLLPFASASAQITGPAITVIKIGVDGGDQNDFQYYGQAGGIAAYSMATTSCNPGTQVVDWTSGDHPVISTNIFRLKDGRFEQLGQSWLKHGFCAVNESGCGSCQSTPCSTLGIGCADTYWATLNDGQGGGPKFQVNANTGTHLHPFPSPSGPSTIRGRLQVLVNEIDPAQNPGAEYFAESQYVSEDTALNGNAHLAASWRRLNVLAVNNIDGGGTTRVNQPAPYAWRSVDPSVTVLDVYNPGEGAGPGARWCVAYKVTDLGGGTWRYDYVVENLTSDRSGYSFSVPASGNLTNVFFRDVDYHSGEPYSNTDWTAAQNGSLFRWRSTQTFTQNANSNALRWGTMYSFGFVADAPPQFGQAEIEMFKPTGGGSDTLLVTVPGPTNCPVPGISAQPQSQEACAGSQVAFSVTASGTGPFTYQWLKDGIELTGETADQLVIASAGPADEGDYSVEVTNGCGTTSSAVATLGVIAGTATIDTPPASADTCAGGAVALSVAATGPGALSYQWLFNGNPIPGATFTQYSIFNATPGDSGSYSVEVSNACGAVTSAAATVTVLSGPPTITGDPQDQDVCAGSPLVLSVSATGATSYQWFHQGKELVGETGTTLVIPSAAPSDAGFYLATASNGCGTETSAQALVGVSAAPPTIDADPASATVCQGSDASFVVAASGSGGLAYQWFFGPNPIPGATASSYQVLGATAGDAGEYRVEVTNACGTVASAAAALEVLPPGCSIGSAVYEVTGTSTGADWCLRLTHCGATVTVTVPGIAPGAGAPELAQALAAAIAAQSPVGGCLVGAGVDPPGSAFVRLSWAGGSLILEVGDASCASFCTVTTMTPCDYNPTLTQVGESPLEPGQALCFCDGGHGAAPCANGGATGFGCVNSSGSGALLAAMGSDSVTLDDAVLTATGVIPNQPGLFFQGTNAIAGGDGVSFGDGLRCCGAGVVRLQVVVPNAGGSASTSVDVAAAGGVSAGDTRCYQFWYRDPAGPCSSTFNLTNGYAVSWSL